MKKILLNLTVTVIFLLSIMTSCRKGYLDIKPDQALLVPQTIADLQALLNNTSIMNIGPGLQVLATDEFHIPTAANLATLNSLQRNAYIWAKDIYEGGTCVDWNGPYQAVFYANIVLDALDKLPVTVTNRSSWETTKGRALFFRAMAFHQLLNQFSAPYSSTTAGSLPGIPLKLSSDVNERPGRGTIAMVNEQVIKDLETSVSLLPDQPDPSSLTRPYRLAAWALLSRVYLINGEYTKAGDCADLVLRSKPDLLDLNTLSPSSTRPISFNTAAASEVIFWYYMTSYAFASSTILGVHPDIVNSYQLNDLRKTIFLRDRGNGIYTFKGNYSGDVYFFTGLATDELYLNRAEAYARRNEIGLAMADLNTLRKKRFSNKITYEPLSAGTQQEAIDLVLAERKKELLTRGARWTDLRRLNLDQQRATVIKRILDNSVVYELSPGDKRYVFPIPQNELDGSGIAQNER